MPAHKIIVLPERTRAALRTCPMTSGRAAGLRVQPRPCDKSGSQENQRGPRQGQFRQPSSAILPGLADRSYEFTSVTLFFALHLRPDDFLLIGSQIQLGDPALTQCSQTLTNGGPPFAKDAV